MRDETEAKNMLVKRLRYLWTWELFASFFLPAVVFVDAALLDQPVGLFTIYASGLVVLLLWQGTAYWRAKLRRVQSGSGIETPILRRFRVFRVVNWFLIAALPLLMGIQALSGATFRSAYDAVAGLGMYALAVLEQINYYHYQLMYDYPPDRQFLKEHKRLKRSSLSRALDGLDDRT